jgi:hypothetical protein
MKSPTHWNSLTSMWKACARLGCPKDDHDPVSPRSSPLWRVFAADGGGRRRHARTPQSAAQRARRPENRRAPWPPIVKTTGDGMLVEFPSVVDAVRCAVEVQRAMPERNADAAPDNRIELCIGINPGEVIVEGDDLYGDPSTSPRGSKLWPTPAGCSSPIRFTKMFATGCPLFSRIWRAAAQKHCPRVERPAGATF